MTNLLAATVVVAVVVGACFQPVDTENAPCPCGDGWECCAATQTCKPTGACDAVDDAGTGAGGGGSSTGGGSTGGGSGGGGGSAAPPSLLALPVVTDGVAPTGVVVPGLTTPAQLGLVGDAIYVLARSSAVCNQQMGAWVPAVSRFEFTNGAWSLRWSTTLPVSGEQMTMVATVDGVTVVGSGQVDGEVARGGTEAFAARVGADGSLRWVRRFATLFDDSASALLARAGGKVVIAGTTGGGLMGNVSQGSKDVWVAQLDADGVVEWVRQLGTSLDESSPSLLEFDSNTFVLSGRTSGALVGQTVPTFPETDLFLRKFDAAGATLWTRQHRLVSTQFVRWGAGFAAGDGERWSEVARLGSDGTLEWRQDFPPLVQASLGVLVPLDDERLALHGLQTKDLLGPGVYPSRELAELIFSADGGVTPTPGIGGGWPQQLGGVWELALEHRADHSWFVAGSVNGNGEPGDILSMSGFEPTGAVRLAHFDWQFTGPDYRKTFTPSERYVAILATPADLGFTPSGDPILIGRVLWKDCGNQAGWLFLAHVHP